MLKRIAIAGIHTDIGKTIVSAIATEALEADYWKPVQAGNLDASDSITVASLISNNKTAIHPEALRLQLAASPHTAAEQEGISFDCRNFPLPETSNILLIETAGGLLSPIDAERTAADFIALHQLPVLFVARHYLGSINHTLLCLEVLQSRGIPLLGCVLSGEPNVSSERFIKAYSDVTFLHSIPQLHEVNRETVKEQANLIEPFLRKILTR